MLTITRPVMVKVRITDSYKKNLAQELQQGAAKMELELQHLELQSRKLQELAKKNPNGVENALAQLAQEKQKRLDTRQKLLDKIKEVGNLVNGIEIIHGKVESLVEVGIGDDWQKLMNAEIVIEDGKVVDIRTLQPEG